MRLAYTLLMYLLLPLVLLRMLWRSLKAPAYRQRWQERLGHIPKPAKEGGLWIHAVSVGEVQAIIPLVQQLLAKQSTPIYITTTTPTGSARVTEQFGQQACHTYLPYDLPIFIGRFLDKVQPKQLLMVETEIWPNLLYSCQQRNIPTLLANARMSAKSQQGYLCLGQFSQTVFGWLDQVAAQTQADAERLITLGVKQSAIRVTGNIKFDMPLSKDRIEQVKMLQEQWQNRPTWVAASTHAGEDSIMLAAHRYVLEKVPNALLILVPRHPERFHSVANLIKKTGLTYTRHSTPSITPDTRVYLGDTMGELPTLMGASQIAFIGGSLVKTGGHNMLEAAVQGIPTCFGPHTFNFNWISQQLLASGAARQVQDTKSLAELIIYWLLHEKERQQAGQAGQELVMQNRGALTKLVDMLLL